MVKKVMVSGCFDLFHTGHLAFLENASKYGELFVSIGSDKTIKKLKNRSTVYSQEERLAIIKGLKCVSDAFIARGDGKLDYLSELDSIKPNIFVVNSDGNSPEKKEICEKKGIEYIVLERIPLTGLPAQSTTNLINKTSIPYRIDLAGGWLDQPFVSKHHPGSVLTVSVEPTIEFNLRSGMATSTRNRAIELWGSRIPATNRLEYEKAAKVLFGFDNQPGTTEIAGSQDSIGIVFPGLNKIFYNGKYWPDSITSYNDDKILNFIENHIALVPLSPRKSDYKVLEETNINSTFAKFLAKSTDNCLEGILNNDINKFGKSVTDSFEAQCSMFPRMKSAEVLDSIKKNSDKAYGWKVSGAGGGGYLILVCDKPEEIGIKINIRRDVF